MRSRPSHRAGSTRIRAAAVLAVATLGLSACGSDADTTSSSEDATAAEDTLVVYSGRNENLVGPLLDQLEEAAGVPVDVRYAGSSELAAQLLEEGDQTDADVFFSQDAGALGALAKEGMLAELDPTVLESAPEQYRAADGTWVATSARARVIAYNPELVPESQVPQSINEVLDPAYAGQVAYAPTNASFHAFVTGLRVLRGEDGAREWLEAFAATDPIAYDNNLLVLDAVDSGEASLGLINHYYWYERVAEVGAENVTAELAYLPGGDPGGLVNVAGVGIIAGTDQPEGAAEAVEFLLSEQAQQFFVDETAEYPVLEGITTTEHDLPELDTLQAPDIDLAELDSLAETLALLDEVGLT